MAARFTAFVPHDLAVVVHSLPPGAMDDAMYDNVKKRYARLTDPVLERVEYEVDGLTVTGVFAHPATLEQGKHPLLVFNRGGSGDYGMLVLPVILRYMVPFAEAGYLTFASNYRGNDGGEGTDEFGGADVHDVLALIELGKQNPAWDGKNIFMLGGSRGGMMTYLAIKDGAPLNAAATFGGIADLSAEDGDWPSLAAKFYARIPDPKPPLAVVIDQRSAVKWPEALARVPLLVMHGTGDTTVPPVHSERLDTALSAHPDHKLVLYPNGNHSLSTHMKEMIAETLGWFERHRR